MCTMYWYKWTWQQLPELCMYPDNNASKYVLYSTYMSIVSAAGHGWPRFKMVAETNYRVYCLKTLSDFNYKI